MRRPQRSVLFVTLGVACVALSGCNLGRWGRGGTPEPAAGADPDTPGDGSSEATLIEADLARDEGDYEKAIELLTRAIEKNPTLTVAHLSLGDVYSEMGDYERAEGAFATAARQEPRNFDAQFKHGLSLQLLNRFSDAVRAYLRALSINPEDFDANLNIATAYMALHEPAQALIYAQQAARIDPNSGPAHANLGSVFSALEQHSQAVREYEAAAELMELAPQLLMNMAVSQGKINRYVEMRNTLLALIELEPSADAYERLGFAEFRLREYAAAELAFRNSIELNASYYPALNGLAVCLLQNWLWSDQEDDAAHAEGVELLRRSLRINRNQPRIVDLLSRYS